MTVRELGTRALAELRLMTLPSTWELIFAQCFPLPPQDGVFVLGTRSRYVQDLIEHRWHRLPEEVLSNLVGRPVQVTCVLVERP